MQGLRQETVLRRPDNIKLHITFYAVNTVKQNYYANFAIYAYSMTGQDINNYRLTSLEEPTDEMLSTIMKEVCDDATRKNEEASARFFGNLKIMVERKQYEWKDRIAEAVNE